MMADTERCSEDCPLAALRAMRQLACCRTMTDPDMVDFPVPPKPPLPCDVGAMVAA